MFGLLYKLLDRRLHRPQNKRGTWQADHFESAYSLMQLLPCDAQLAGIEGRQIRAACRLCISDETFERLGGAFQGLSELVKYPSQRPEIVDGRLQFGSF